MKGIIRAVAVFSAALSCGVWVGVTSERALRGRATCAEAGGMSSEGRGRAEAERRLSGELAVKRPKAMRLLQTAPKRC